jgi:hypothetical protein
MCCLLFDVPELEKPENEWCKHCRPGRGCGIYNERPDICRRYVCMWLAGDMPDYWQPVRSKMILDFELSSERDVLRVVVHPDYPNRWQEEPYYQDIKMLVRKFRQTRIVSPHKPTIYLDPDLDIETQLLINDRDRERLDPDPEIEDDDDALDRAMYEAMLDDVESDRLMREIER